MQRTLGHDAVNRQLELAADLRHAQFGQSGLAATLRLEQGVTVEDGGLATFDGNVHGQAPVPMVMRVVRGRPRTCWRVAR